MIWKHLWRCRLRRPLNELRLDPPIQPILRPTKKGLLRKPTVNPNLGVSGNGYGLFGKPVSFTLGFSRTWKNLAYFAQRSDHSPVLPSSAVTNAEKGGWIITGRWRSNQRLGISRWIHSFRVVVSILEFSYLRLSVVSPIFNHHSFFFLHQ